MQLDKKHQWLLEAKQCPSPNCEPRIAPIDLLVIHSISLPPGEFGGKYIDCLFTNTLPSTAHPTFATLAELKVSAHLLVDRQGQITQYVPFDCCAWHAGASEFQGRTHCNDFSIGIELEGDEVTNYQDIQYQVLAEITDCLVKTWPALCYERIVGHVDIAPNRKTDPGATFDWNHYFSLCKGLQKS